jgi:GTP-binding protein
LLSRVSRARPAIADYPFTTTEPHLGIVSFADSYDSMVVADIPGLIEDSHKGRGLGIRFLRHIERTRALAIMVESTSEDPRADAKVLLSELKSYSDVLAEKPMVFVLTKTDLLPKRRKPPKGWLGISAVTGEGLDALLSALRDMLKQVPAGDTTAADE